MPTITVNGRTYAVVEERVPSRTASARLNGGTIAIRIPSSCPPAEAQTISQDLLRRMIRKIERHPRLSRPWRPLRFAAGQTVEALGQRLLIAVENGARRSSGRLAGETVRIRLAAGLSEEEEQEHTSVLARRLISHAVLPVLRERIDFLNRELKAPVKRIFLKDHKSRWGSYSPRGVMNLNVRLLFAPPEVLNYVIVHELAHSRYRGHGTRFWRLVEQAVPDHRTHRKWLRENGHRLGPAIQ